jgi:hypothetical protein
MIYLPCTVLDLTIRLLILFSKFGGQLLLSTGTSNEIFVSLPVTDPCFIQGLDKALYPLVQFRAVRIAILLGTAPLSEKLAAGT